MATSVETKLNDPLSALSLKGAPSLSAKSDDFFAAGKSASASENDQTATAYVTQTGTASPDPEVHVTYPLPFDSVAEVHTSVKSPSTTAVIEVKDRTEKGCTIKNNSASGQPVDVQWTAFASTDNTSHTDYAKRKSDELASNIAHTATVRIPGDSSATELPITAVTWPPTYATTTTPKIATIARATQPSSDADSASSTGLKDLEIVPSKITSTNFSFTTKSKSGAKLAFSSIDVVWVAVLPPPALTASGETQSDTLRVHGQFPAKVRVTFARQFDGTTPPTVALDIVGHSDDIPDGDATATKSDVTTTDFLLGVGATTSSDKSYVDVKWNAQVPA